MANDYTQIHKQQAEQKQILIYQNDNKLTRQTNKK